MVRKIDLTAYMEKYPRFSILAKRPDYFANVQIQTGGYGIQWDENLSIPDSALYDMGRRIPLTATDFRAFAAEWIVNAAEAAEILNCSRQYINELVKTDKLHPIKATGKNTMFLKSEVLRKNWQ